VTDAAGTRTFSYYESWTDDSYEAELRNKSGRPQSETLPAFLGGHTLTYDYQYGVSGRANGAASGLQLDTGSLYSVAYGYDALLRPGSVTYNGGTPWVYSYVANANLIDTVSQTGGYSRDYDYLSDSNRLDKMKHQWGASSASAVETRVTYDPSSRLRNTEKTQGTAWMSVLGRSDESGVHTDYSYTDRYELTSSGKYLLNADWSVGAAVTGTAREYAFDPIGNRMSDQAGSYTPNELNQYTATPTAATLTYDANGNLTGDGAATYAYDAENRLITMNRVQGAKSRYTYDYLGRRIRRTATGMTTQRYLYDGWNLIAELDDSGTITRQFVWGLDVSGSAQGAGGVGGLLEIDAGGTSQYYPIYDASHNVIGLYSGTGAIAAAYEYDPFGNKQTGLGTYAKDNPFRFSTKYTDPDSGLVYYGMRYYSAKLGRFLNQDPIEEAGGINLYAFCGNDGVNRFDLLGLDSGFLDWLGSIFGGGSSSSSSRPPDIPGEYADATVRLPEITVGGGGNPGQSGDVSSAGDSSHYDAIKSYQDGRTIDDVNASMRSNSTAGVDLSTPADRSYAREVALNGHRGDYYPFAGISSPANGTYFTLDNGLKVVGAGLGSVGLGADISSRIGRDLTTLAKLSIRDRQILELAAKRIGEAGFALAIASSANDWRTDRVTWRTFVDPIMAGAGLVPSPYGVTQIFSGAYGLGTAVYDVTHLEADKNSHN
jgi:RHS repeat-associated protein